MIFTLGKENLWFLTEMVANYDAIEAIICGIGINMNHVEDDFNDEIRHIATSMRLHADDKINRYDFLKYYSMRLINVINNS